MMRDERKRFLIKPFLILFLIYLIGISAIILSNTQYADDAARTNYGYAGWSAFSRYLSTILSHGLHADNYLTNIAPLPQILAAAILAVSSMIVIITVSGREIFEEKWTKWIFSVVAVVPLGLCPYMLECLSYQYDAVYMGLSVFFAVMPLLFREKSPWLYGLMLMVGVLGVCMTYQVSIGILPMLVVYVAMKNWSERKDNLRFVLISLGVFVVTLLIFQKVLMAPKDVYVSNEIPGVSEFFPALFAHLSHYFELLFSDFKILWLVLIGIMMVGFVVAFFKESKRNKILTVLIGMAGVCAMGMMSFLLYSALETPLYTTRAMYAVGAFIAIMGVYIARKKSVFVGAAAVLSWCFFVFAFTYGNALGAQKNYRDMVVNMVISDVNEILPKLGAGEKYIQTTGQIDFAPAVKHMPEKDFDLVRRLLKPSFGSDVYWMAYRLTEASGVPGLKFDQNINLLEKNLPILKETALYIIYGDVEGILVDFKGVSFSEVVNE